MVVRGKIIKNPDEPCFDCGEFKKPLDYFMCGNGEWQGHCLECLEILQGPNPELIREKFRQKNR